MLLSQRSICLFLNSSIPPAQKIKYISLKCIAKLVCFFFVVIFEYHLEVWKASIFFYMNGFPSFFFNDKAA